MEIPRVFKQLRDIRRRLNLNQDDMADFFGVAQTTWSAFENGHLTKIDLSLIDAFLRKYKVDPRLLFDFPDANHKIPAWEDLPGDENPKAVGGE